MDVESHAMIRKSITTALKFHVGTSNIALLLQEGERVLCWVGKNMHRGYKKHTYSAGKGKGTDEISSAKDRNPANLLTLESLRKRL